MVASRYSDISDRGQHMSNSEGTTRASGTIQLIAPDDVQFSIVSGLSDEVAKGFGTQTITLLEGIYSVKWFCGELVSEKLIRVFEENEKNKPIEFSDRTLNDEVRSVASVLEQHCTGIQSGVMLLIPWQDGRPYVSFARFFRLSKDASGLESSKASEPTVIQKNGLLVLIFDVSPGTYSLHYNSVERIRLQQTVQVYASRLTVALVTLLRVARPEGAAEKARFRVRDGVEPSAMRIVSIARSAPSTSIATNIRLAGTLLSRLAVKAEPLPPELFNAAHESTDPYIQTYALALVLGRLDGNLNSFREAVALDPKTAGKALALISHPNLYVGGRCAPDIDCGWWRLALGGFAKIEVASEKRFDQLSHPPLLETSWDWATAWSLVNPGTNYLSSEIMAASTSRVRAGPWLVWRGRTIANEASALLGSEGNIVQGAVNLTAALKNTVEIVAEAFEKTSKRLKDEGQAAGGIASYDLAQLSQGTKRLVANVAALSQQTDSDLGLLESLVLKMKAPLTVVANEVERAQIEMNLATAVKKDEDLFTQDPWKGRFGGEDQRDIYRLVLKNWKRSNTRDILALEVAVTCHEPKKTRGAGPVRFYLHPTFNPYVHDVPWEDGESSLRCYAVGGFTIGAILDNGIKLELDLAQDDRLPPDFRAR